MKWRVVCSWVAHPFALFAKGWGIRSSLPAGQLSVPPCKRVPHFCPLLAEVGILILKLILK